MMPTFVPLWGLVFVMALLIVEAILRRMKRFSKEADSWFASFYAAGCVFFLITAWPFFRAGLEAIRNDMQAMAFGGTALLVSLLAGRMANRKKINEASQEA